MDQQGMWRWDGLLRWVAEIAGVLSLNLRSLAPVLARLLNPKIACGSMFGLSALRGSRPCDLDTLQEDLL